MMVFDHVGDQEAIVYVQLGQQPLVRITETSPEPGRGTLSCLSAQPPDLPFWTGTRSRVVSQRVPEHVYTPIEHFYTPIARRRREPIPRLSLYGRLKSEHLWGGSTASSLAIVHFGSVGRLWGLFERSKAT